MRQDKYRLEKKTYKEPKYIQKQDRLYKTKFPQAYRYHIFVKLKIISKDEPNIFTGMYENKTVRIHIQNMDGYFYFAPFMKNRMQELLDNII